MRTKSVVEAVVWAGLYGVVLVALGGCGGEGGVSELLECGGGSCAQGRSAAALTQPSYVSTAEVENLCLEGAPNGVVEGKEQCDGTAGCTQNCRVNACEGGYPDGMHNPIVEECDDSNEGGNRNACTNYCKHNVCGDGFPFGPTQLCDDGNDEDEDGCTNACEWNVCGDGFHHGYLNPEHPELGREECDDGNEETGDACPSGAAGTCLPATCGDGFLWVGVELCELGDELSGYPEAECIDCTWTVLCGNGTVDAAAGETCDDGVDCTDEVCNGDERACTSRCLTAKCGDAWTHAGHELCDDGVNNRVTWSQERTCNTQCEGWAPHCGDGTANGPEACDSGTDCTDGKACNSDGWIQARHCNATCTGVGPHCGDGVPNGTEVCDDGADNGKYGKCATDCMGRAPQYCGNGVIEGQEGENCEPPVASNACPYGVTSCQVCDLVECKLKPGVPSYCGDGVTNEGNGEQCDDGVDCSDGVCNHATKYCTPECKIRECGDGYVYAYDPNRPNVPGEECDLGSNCATGQCNDDHRWCTSECKTNYCGDGKVWTGKEACDEGALNGQPGRCRTDCSGRCGDGEKNGDEKCDEGALNGQPGRCRTDCSGRCGDGEKNGDEECDDGNTSNNDDCLNNCVKYTCGDYQWHHEKEKCDEGILNGSYNHCNVTCSGIRGCTDGVCEAGLETCSCADCTGRLACNDGNACTLNDLCTAGGGCSGTPKSCPPTTTSSCSYANACAKTGSGTRTTTTYACRPSDGACVSTGSTTSSYTCSRNTDGNSCSLSTGGSGVCSNGRCVRYIP